MLVESTAFIAAIFVIACAILGGLVLFLLAYTLSGQKKAAQEVAPSQLEMKLFSARGWRRRECGLLRKAPNQGSSGTTLRCCLLYGRHSQYASGLRYNDACS